MITFTEHLKTLERNAPRSHCYLCGKEDYESELFLDVDQDRHICPQCAKEIGLTLNKSKMIAELIL